VEYVYGAPREALLEFAQSLGLLVCGSRRNGPARRVALATTSEFLARHVQSLLLIAPPIDAPTVKRWREQRQTAPA
jgi:nucleotide-binding universal stress UspA family protein